MFVLLTLGLVVAGKAVGAGVAGIASGVGWIAERPQRRRAHIEAELDRTQAQLRRTVLQLATEISNAGLDARKDLLQQAYVASRGLPPAS
ncbi:MAG TPA: hypothetical protein VHZ98_16025 [Galbitalea sp.]|jgi:hypothetical protein|nr:hypothetical protein [Galbitalea sp.]